MSEALVITSVLAVMFAVGYALGRHQGYLRAITDAIAEIDRRLAQMEKEPKP